MKLSDDWNDFMLKLERIDPKVGDQLAFDLEMDAKSPRGR